MDYKLNDGTLEIALIRRIESNNANEVGAELDKICAANPHESIVLDAGELEYISSAGLRVLLRLQKSERKRLSVINVSGEVYEIFEMTGFAQLMDIKKAMRFVSIKGLEMIGRGGNGCVYRLDRDTMIKSFYNAKSVEEIDKGREYARAAFIRDIPTAISYETVKCEDGYGILFELLHAKPLSDVIMEDEEHRDEYIDKYIDLLIKLHTTEVEEGEFPAMNDSFMMYAEAAKPYITDEEYNKFVEFLNWLPRRNTLVHGDFHTHNIMVQDGELILIDMDDVCVGHPVIELGGMLLAYYYLPRIATNESIRKFLHLSVELSHELWDRVVRRYFKTDDEAQIETINKKLMSYMNFRKFCHSIIRGGDDEMMMQRIEVFRKDVLPRFDEMMADEEFLKEMPVL